MLKLLQRAALAGAIAIGSAQAQSPAPIVIQPARTDPHAMHEMLLDAARAGQRIVAVGASGYVVLSDDGGASYRQAKKVPVDFTLTSVAFTDASNGWAAGHGGAILHTVDGGENWALQRSDITVDQPLFSIYFSDANNGWAAGLWSLLLHTTDGGKSWEQVRLPVPEGQKRGDLNLLHIFGGPGGWLYLSAEQGTVYRSTDGGARWEVIKTGSKASLWRGVAMQDGTVVVGGLGGKLLRSTDGGSHWENVASPTNGSITGMRTDGKRIVASSLSGSLLMSDDEGASWRELAMSRQPLTALALRDGDAARPLAYFKGGPAKLEPRSGQ